MAQSRQACYWRDIKTLLSNVQESNRFPLDITLHNGVLPHNNINVDTVKIVGNTILSSMEGTTPADFTFRRIDWLVVKLDGLQCR